MVVEETTERRPMETGTAQIEKLNRKKFPFIIMGVSSAEEFQGSAPAPQNINNPDLQVATKHIYFSSGDKHKLPTRSHPKEVGKHSKKYSPFTAVNGTSIAQEPGAIHPQKPVRNNACETKPQPSQKNRVPDISGLQDHQQNPSVPFPRSSHGDFLYESKQRSEQKVDPPINSSTSGKDFYDFHDWSLHEKFDELFSGMRQREDEILRLRAEICDLKDTISRHTAENGASKLLYQTLQRQLDTIEERVELQENCPSNSGSESTITSSKSCSETSIFNMDFDRFMRAVKDLNSRVDRGQCMELCYTTGGASFKRWDGVNLTLYRNGLLLGTHKEFIPFTSSRAKLFVQDILDGFFPNEFQSTYPHGVFIIATDQRSVSFKGDVTFCGEGKTLNKSVSRDCGVGLPQLVPGRHLRRFKQRQFSPSSSTSSSAPPSPNLKATNSTPSSQQGVEELPTVEASYDVLLSKKIVGVNDRRISVKLRDIKNGRSYRMKTSIFATVQEIVDHLSRVVETELDDQVVLIHSVPMGILAVKSATLSDYGIEGNTVLFFRLDKCCEVSVH